MNTPNFIEPFREAIDELSQNHPPQIELRGWWWKKFIPYYRKLREVMQQIIYHEWKNNYPEIRKQIEEMSKEWWEKELRSEFIDRDRLNNRKFY